MLLATVIFILIPLTFLSGWWVMTIGLVLAYSTRYNTAFLLPLAIVLDGYFNRFETIPYLSLGMVVWFLVVEQVRPIMWNVLAE